MNLIGKYINGNYEVKIYNDGTKIRETINSEDDEFLSSFPECIDLKITNQCDLGCLYCHENSIIDGKHSDLLNVEFINTLKPFTELALGGGNTISHPDLEEFLYILKDKNIIANMTVSQHHFMNEQEYIKKLVENNLIKGIGVSLNYLNEKFIETVSKYKNAVIHVINGVVKLEDLQALYSKNLKILMLGYKQIRRGKDFYSQDVEDNMKKMYENIQHITKGFKVMSFDNLAIKQLELRRLFTNKDWEEFYMGDDGSHTMYIDLVEREYAQSSTSLTRHKVSNDIIDMFNVVKSNSK